MNTLPTRAFSVQATWTMYCIQVITELAVIATLSLTSGMCNDVGMRDAKRRRRRRKGTGEALPTLPSIDVTGGPPSLRG